jgi:ER-bound oxygenase mpaB/B'/Rubber oxygenase, catalytic domain
VMRLVHSAPQSASAIHTRVHHFLTNGALPPAWIDDSKINTARRFFADHALDITSVLFYCALPTCYACGDGAEVVRLTEEMVSHTHRRTSETAQFIFEVMGYGQDQLPGAASFEPGTRVHHAIMGVRLVHGTVRSYARLRLVSKSDPINHEEMLGTILAFSTVTLRGLRRIGIEPTKEEQAAYWHTWAVVGAMLGIDEHLVNVDLDEAYRLTDRLSDRLVRPSKAGAELAEALLKDMHRSSVAIMGPAGRLVRSVHPALIRYMSRPDVATALGLKPSRMARSFVRVTPAFISMGHRMRRNWSPMRRMSNWWAREILREYMTLERPNRPKFDFGLATEKKPLRSKK